ncbi:MAG: hypothetical protein H0V17_34565 [Deltaproteobacteria bacterium]|nr:hypothetical protein [Deltaproteobacteria bacterium]
MKAILLCAVLIGCGGSGTPGGDDDDTPNDGPGAIVDSPPIPDGFVRLMGRTWTLPAPSGSTPDEYRCVRFTPTEDMFITSIQAQAPVGTHHTVLSIAGSNGTSGADGVDDSCDFQNIGMVMLYASGLNESKLDFPTDVGLHIKAGEQLHLNLHLFNATDFPISGDTAILVKAQPTAPPTLAEMVFAGKFIFQVQAGTPEMPKTTTVTGGCNNTRTFTTFAVWPHMHQLGSHQKVSVVRGGNTTVLHDGDYSFQEQNYYLQDPMFDVLPGDRINVECTWVNTGAATSFGESSTQEMCFSGFYRFPAQNAGLFECASEF